ncbi:MAG: 1,4-dihydroxy-2-naphthoate polyprenyltransferase [Opitutaceae bacterium]|nr:1,4-dihydroxy-2-naphthoate polyprenyltransferase [Opitutaceae bacterium]
MEKSPVWSIWIEATRPKTLPAAVAPVLVGTALAAHGGSADYAAAGLCLLFALLIQIGTNFANDYYDFIQGADSASRVGPRRAVAAGLVRPAVMKRAMVAVFALAFAVGLGLVAWGGPGLIVIGVASIACGVAYTGGPFPLGYNGLGDLFVFIFFGLVAVGATFFVQAGEMTVNAILAAIPIGLLAANILVVNNYRDVETDRAAGKRTLVVRFGRGAARAQFDASLVVAFALPLVFWARGFSPWVLAPLVLAPVAWRQARRLKASETPAELIALLGDTGKLVAGYAVLLSGGLWF